MPIVFPRKCVLGETVRSVTSLRATAFFVPSARERPVSARPRRLPAGQGALPSRAAILPPSTRSGPLSLRVKAHPQPESDTGRQTEGCRKWASHFILTDAIEPPSIPPLGGIGRPALREGLPAERRDGPSNLGGGYEINHRRGATLLLQCDRG